MTGKYFAANFNAKPVIKLLKDISKKLEDISPLMKVSRVFLKKTVNENFNTEGSHTGNKWKSWSDKWKKRRLKMKRGNGKILSLSGELQKSITAKSGKNFAIVGTNKVYAALHNFGGDIKRNGKKVGKMPERKFMRLNQNAVNELWAELYLAAEDLIFEQELHKKAFGK